MKEGLTAKPVPVKVEGQGQSEMCKGDQGAEGSGLQGLQAWGSL